MEHEIDIYGYMLNISVVFFVMLFFIVFLMKLNSIIMAILAYPTYIALLTFEHFSRYNSQDLEKRKFFRLNIPKNNPKKYWMNLIASITTFLSINIAIKIILIIQIPDLQINFFKNIFNGTLVSYPLSITIILLILIIYSISYFIEIDTRTAYDKIEDLNIPSLWKNIIK